MLLGLLVALETAMAKHSKLGRKSFESNVSNNKEHVLDKLVSAL
jgi:hypothetical protein